MWSLVITHLKRTNVEQTFIFSFFFIILPMVLWRKYFFVFRIKKWTSITNLKKYSSNPIPFLTTNKNKIFEEISLVWHEQEAIFVQNDPTKLSWGKIIYFGSAETFAGFVLSTRHNEDLSSVDCASKEFIE